MIASAAGGERHVDDAPPPLVRAQDDRAAAIRRLLDLAALELDEVADAQAGLPREPHRVRMQLWGPAAEEVDLGVLPDDLGAVGALVEARDAVQVVDRHPLGVAPGRPAERELERVEALVGGLAGPVHLDPVEHVALERDAVDDAERRAAVPGPHVDQSLQVVGPGARGEAAELAGALVGVEQVVRPCASRGPSSAARAPPARRSPRRRRPGSPAFPGGFGSPVRQMLGPFRPTVWYSTTSPLAFRFRTTMMVS